MDGITPPSSDGGNGVVISPHDMYAEILATHDAVLAIATKLDTALTQGADH